MREHRSNIRDAARTPRPLATTRKEISILKKMISGLTIALALAFGTGAAEQAAAAPLGAGSNASWPAYCATHPAAFTVQTVQGLSIYSLKRLVVHGTCLTQGASITIWDDAASVSLTGGRLLVPTDAIGQFVYTVSNAPCAHLLRVRVLDLAHDTLAVGNGKTYGPCQSPPPVFTQ